MVYSFDLSEKVVVITGGYGYLGKAICESLLFHGAQVFVLGKSKDKFIQAFGKDLHQQLYFVTCDISSTSKIQTAISEVISHRGRIDVLINNAVYSRGRNPDNLSDEDWSYTLEGVLESTYKFIREVIPIMRNQKSGSIINVSSMYGVVAPQFEVYEQYTDFLNPPHYGAAKAGVIQMTKYFASYLGKQGILVNSVSPGPFPSESISENKGFVKELEAKTCLGRVGKPEDLAGIFVFLSSEASRFITGHNFVVDGGWTIK
jgi:NAD(P)-dependent dehydrogenase (short-subunit alcohol dehydrogenase family)